MKGNNSKTAKLIAKQHDRAIEKLKIPYLENCNQIPLKS